MRQHLGTWLAIPLLLGAGAGAQLGPVAHAPPPIPARPTRVVSVTLAADEILLDLISPTRIAALGTFADDLRVSHVVDRATAVSARARSDGEVLLGLRPDLVVTSRYGSAASMALLGQARVPVLELDPPSTVDDVRRNILRLGAAVGESAQATRLVATLDRDLADVRAQREGHARPTVLVIQRGGYTTGRGTIVDQLIAHAGGRNAAAEAGVVGHAPLEVEQLAQLTADLVLHSDYSADARGRQLGRPSLLGHPLLAHSPLLRQAQVTPVAARVLLTTSHHLGGAVRELARIFTAWESTH